MVQVIISIGLPSGVWGGKKQQEAGEGLSKVRQAQTLWLFRRYQFLPCGATRPQRHSTMALALKSIMLWAMLIPATLIQESGSSDTVLL